ncbi:DUF3526 domain-containing protein [Chitinophaga sp. S165]|uniref:ABC transporter permease n=1 Tax=Chitinophaga sp. S165 TaxID=2135462 RepID=UPI000D71D28C|nr:DUF3526 domain-containing protein [Chitinophaga sp. S165]PWV55885.1 ABC-2 type transport system permease protein [Chitinophaga sp. S165]
MRRDVLLLLAKQLVSNAFRNKAIVMLLGIVAILLIYATYSCAGIYLQETQSRQSYQKEVREHWEEMPDKHPHRMAHYGYIVFRPKSPLSIFDPGMESYVGNAVFLEAHRQNSVNFSEAGFSTGMLRFGEISMAMILQILVPLVIFFIGFNTVAADRENGTLKILLGQGVSWKEIMTGKIIGLFGIALSLLLLVLIFLIAAGVSIPQKQFTADDLLLISWIMLCYAVYFGIISIVAVLISAYSRTAKLALVSLISIWLLWAIILPRTMQAAGNFLYASPSRIEFETAIEKELIQKGDSHNPDDPYYKALKDSVLRIYNASSVEQLPFNYSGFQMKEGERISAVIYNQHLFALLDRYQQQNDVSRLSAFVNPLMALRNLSMSISGTGFNNYTRFQQQAEAYRYQLAQHMNDLQIKLISNKKPGDNDKPYSISSEHWKSFPDFSYKTERPIVMITSETLSLFALLCWMLLLITAVSILSKKLKAI